MRSLVLLLLVLLLPVQVYAGVMSPVQQADMSVQYVTGHDTSDVIVAVSADTPQLPDVADDAPQLAFAGDLEETPLPANLPTSHMTRLAFLRPCIVSAVVEAQTISVFRPPRFA